jgi:hypothetical protein
MTDARLLPIALLRTIGLKFRKTDTPIVVRIHLPKLLFGECRNFGAGDRTLAQHDTCLSESWGRDRGG